MGDQFQTFLLFFPIIVISIAIHEFAHCWTTDRLGDDTPRMQGRVTLNPIVHLDPMGTVMIVVSSLFGFGIGWGRPSPVNPNNFQKPMRDYMISALAGPMSNIIQMLCWAALIPLLGLLLSGAPFTFAMQFCILGVMINAVLFLFNLLPIYPLDGHVILAYFLPESARPIIMNPAWGYVFLAIVLVPQLRNAILLPFLMTGRESLMGFAEILAL